eukprot:gene40449-10069_t
MMRSSAATALLGYGASASHVVSKGRAGGGCNEPGGCSTQCADDSDARPVRCCADNEIAGWSGANANWGCTTSVWHESDLWTGSQSCMSDVPQCASRSYDEAAAMCDALNVDGARLCTREEVAGGCTRGSCMLDDGRSIADGAEFLNECDEHCRCEGGSVVGCCRLRKEYATAHNPAFHALVDGHRQLFNTGIHRTGAFLPWH